MGARKLWSAIMKSTSILGALSAAIIILAAGAANAGYGAASHAATSGVHYLNPQPLPPAAARYLNPQPLPPG
jgi:hypothetical protein